MKNNVRRMLPAFALLVSLASPFAAIAQVDDVYFVPSKKSEEKVLVIKSTAEKYNISTASASQGRDVDEYNRRSTAYTDSPDEYIDENYTGDYSYEEGAYDDYSYSTRIIRFRNPRRAMYSPIYWDLMYGCGVSDWLIYDNGYSIDIYPTYNNHLYFYSDFAFGWNPFSWYSWNSWHYPGYYGWYHPYHSPYYNHFYGHYYPGHLMAGAGGGYWGPARCSTRFVPTNGAVSGGRSARGEGARSERGTVSGSRADRGSMRADGNVRRNGSTGNGRSVAQNGNKRNESGAGFRVESNNGKTQGRDNAIRRQQPSRGSVNNGGNRGANGNVNAGVRQESSKGASGSSSVNRRESGASSGYNRPSSTSTVRSRSSSSSSSSSSSVRSGSNSSRSSSSYSSGSSSSRSSSSYGSSSGSSRSSSSFGGSSGSSRGSSSGGSRSGGRGR